MRGILLSILVGTAMIAIPSATAICALDACADARVYDGGDSLCVTAGADPGHGWLSSTTCRDVMHFDTPQGGPL